MMKSCRICGIAFNAPANHKTCGTVCGKTLSRKTAKRMPKYRNCVICKKNFRLKTSGSEITCSKECSVERKRQTTNTRQRKKRGTTETISCVICGKPVAVWGTTKTHEGECRDELRNRYKPIWKAKRRTIDREKTRATRAKWLENPQNRETVRKSQRNWNARHRSDPEQIAKRRRSEANRREKQKAKGIKRSLIDQRSASLRHAVIRSEMTADQIKEYRRKKAAEMRKRMADPVKGARVRELKREERKRKHKGVFAISVLRAIEGLSDLIKGN